MHTYIAQELVTIRGRGATTITQGENSWLDLSGYQDVVAWLEVFEFTVATTLTMSYETAPKSEATQFVAMSGSLTNVPFSITAGQTITPMLKELLTVPLARWFRWSLVTTGAGAWDVTFRLHLAANCVGPRSQAKQQAMGRP